MRTKQSGSRSSMGNCSIDASVHLLQPCREDEDIQSWCKLCTALRSHLKTSFELNAIDVIHDRVSPLKRAHRHPVSTAPMKPMFLKNHVAQPAGYRNKWNVERPVGFAEKAFTLWRCPTEMFWTLYRLEHIGDYLQTWEQGQRLAEEDRAS